MSPAPARVLRSDEQRPAAALFAATLQQPPPTDEQWDSTGAAIQPERTRRGVLTELMRAQLADFGRIGHTGPDAPAVADRLFTAHRAPWCGTFF